LRWFEREARDLPWRRTSDPYLIWVSEVILQQTRVEQGLPYYERFIAAFPTVDTLAAAPLDRVLKLWEGLGYYTRARNMHLAAQRVVAEHGGVMPARAELLQLLPGVGRYTAAAVASIAYGEQVAVVDGNVKRVLSRLFNVEECIDDTAIEHALWDRANRLVPQRAPGDFNQAMMELGARICTPRKPDCDGCPVMAQCEARRLGVAESRPVRKAKTPPRQKELLTAVIREEGKYLLMRRPDEGLLGGLWEFPSFEMTQACEPGAFLEAACRKELGLRVKPGGILASVKHAYTHFKVSMTVYACKRVSGEPKPGKHTEWAWVDGADLASYALHKSQHKILDVLR
jgi:A/G-specific adenine glycosylase